MASSLSFSSAAPPPPPPTCAECGAALPSDLILRCARCKQAKYCNVECQRAHWAPVHKQHCRAARLVAVPVAVPVADSPSPPPPPHVDAVALLPELGLELRATRSRGGRHSSLTLFTTAARRAGELVLRETSDLIGTLVELVPRVYASPALAALMMPREGHIEFLDAAARCEYAGLCNANPTLSADAVASVYCKLRTNTWALAKGDGVWRAPGAVSTDDAGKLDQAVFALAQFMDNACDANIGQLVERNATCAEYRGYALRDLAAGEKICRPYVFELLPRAARRQQLGFECECDQCRSGPDVPPRSTWPACVAPIAAESRATGQTLAPEWTRAATSERHVARFPDRKESPSVLDAAPVFAQAWRDGRLQALDFAATDRGADFAAIDRGAAIRSRVNTSESADASATDLRKFDASVDERK